MDADRKTLLGLLTKMDAPFTKKIETERAQRKLVRYLKEKGVPAELTAAEADMVKLLTGKTPEVPGKAPVVKAKEKTEKKQSVKEPKEKKPRKHNVAPHSFMFECIAKTLLKKQSISPANAEQEAFALYNAKCKEFSSTKWVIKISVVRAGTALITAGVLSWDAEKRVYLRK